ncbi:hypothetical protein B0H14DRAFT_2558785 [Mycena olivaceomarginata]|nr:hypothetical protein B0H14DRAFT_2558785 [Mycena olivaceomarginata]
MGLTKTAGGWKETALWRKGDRADGPRPCGSGQWTDDGVLGDGGTRMGRKKEMGEAKRTGRKSSTTCQPIAQLMGTDFAVATHCVGIGTAQGWWDGRRLFNSWNAGWKNKLAPM